MSSGRVGSVVPWPPAAVIRPDRVIAPAIRGGAPGSRGMTMKQRAAADLVERRLAHRRHRQLRRPLETEVGGRLGVAQVERDLGRLQQDVQRHDGGAGLEDAEVDDREVGHVGARQRDAVAAADALGAQAGRDHAGLDVEQLVGEARRAADHRRAVRRQPHGAIEEVRDVQGGGGSHASGVMRVAPRRGRRPGRRACDRSRPAARRARPCGRRRRGVAGAGRWRAAATGAGAPASACSRT